MRQSRKHVLPIFALLVASAPVFSQTALHRSTELCAEVQSTAIENGRKFEVLRPGACRVSLDTGYFLYVSNFDRFLHLSLGVDADRAGLFGPQASAYMLHLSAFDNLAYAALGTKPQSVFDGLDKLGGDFALELGVEFALKLAGDSAQEIRHTTFVDGKADRAILMVTSIDNGKIWLHSASADVSDIDQMKSAGEQDSSTLPQAEDQPGMVSKTDGHVPTWRRILGLSLQVFGAGAQGYANAYRGPNVPQGQSQPPYSAPKTCYTNFIGATAFTNCY